MSVDYVETGERKRKREREGERERGRERDDGQEEKYTKSPSWNYQSLEHRMLCHLAKHSVQSKAAPAKYVSQ